MLEGVNSEDKEMVTTVKDVIKAVLDGVKVCEASYRKHTSLYSRRDLAESQKLLSAAKSCFSVSLPLKSAALEVKWSCLVLLKDQH